MLPELTVPCVDFEVNRIVQAIGTVGTLRYTVGTVRYRTICVCCANLRRHIFCKLPSVPLKNKN